MLLSVVRLLYLSVAIVKIRGRIQYIVVEAHRVVYLVFYNAQCVRLLRVFERADDRWLVQSDQLAGVGVSLLELFYPEDFGNASNKAVVQGLVFDLTTIVSVKFNVSVLDATTIALFGVDHNSLMRLFVVQKENIVPVEALSATTDLTFVYFEIVVTSVMFPPVSTGTKLPVTIFAGIRFFASVGPLVNLKIGLSFENFSTDFLCNKVKNKLETTMNLSLHLFPCLKMYVCTY